MQFVPQIAPLAAELTIFQRSANWLLPRKDRLYTPGEQCRRNRWRWLARLHHKAQWFFIGELQLTPLMKHVRIVQWLATYKSVGHLRRQVRDPALRAKLVPDYPIGAKRVLYNDDDYPTLGRDNVRLVTRSIERIEPDGVRTRNGELVPVDVIVFATGFHATDFLAPMAITGAHAYPGVTVSGFPNLFMLYNPNTNLGHNSILVMIEVQVSYILDTIRQMDACGLRRIDVRREVMDEYNRGLQRNLAKTVWSADKQSWYKLADGTITNNWPHCTIRYRRLLRRADLEAYDTAGA